ncbi:MAG: hypothetical protein KC636_26405, partial [Myxococcales bacterium]|nr:hypothetical protein [Myxococcales bacterium]
LGWNNLVLASGDGDIAPGGDVDWDAQGNITGVAIADLGFVDPDAGDFHLQESAQAVGAGVPAGDWSSQDRDGVDRDPAAPDVGAYEYTTEPPPPEPPDDDTGGSTDGGSTDGGNDDVGEDDLGAGDGDSSGCACNQGGDSALASSLALLLLLLGGLVLKPRAAADPR